MPRTLLLRAPLIAAAAFALATFPLVASSARADYSETILHTFVDNNADGEFPAGCLVETTDGSFWGTTDYGGTAGKGTVYKIPPGGALAVVHSFGDGSVTNDGNYPASGLTIGSDGNLYGTTVSGGQYSVGTVFKISPSSGAVTILHSFANDTDGAYPQAGVTFGADGKLYTTTNNGTSGESAEYGTVCSMNTDGSSYLVQFRFNSSNGSTYGLEPVGRLVPVPGSTSNQFYGANFGGGSATSGTIFKITPHTADGGAGMALVHAFGDGSVSNDGDQPSNDDVLVTDSSGNIYGDTLYGGSEDDGVVFKISSSGAVTILHNFGIGTDGTTPNGGLTLGSDGNLYGATQSNTSTSQGTIYHVSTSGSSYGIGYNFGATASDGVTPYARPIEDSDGNLVGPCYDGGSSGGDTAYGIVYKLAAGLPNPVKLSKLSLSPTSVAGGQANSTGTIALANPAPSSGAVVTLKSSNTSVATVPSSVTVPANHLHSTFTITSKSVTSSTNVTITATYNGSTETQTLTVTPAAIALQSVTLAASSTYGGTSLAGNRIYLTGDATADTKVTLTSSDTSVATVPSSETILAGSSSHSFTITTYSVTATKTVTITATYNGVSKTATLTVMPGLSSLTLATSSIKGGSSFTGSRIALTGMASSDTKVTLTSSNTAVATVPSSETILSGSSSHSFTVTTMAVTKNTTVTITATLGAVSKTATLTVTP